MEEKQTMDIEQSVLEKLRVLPPEKQQEVLDCIEFLGQKQTTAKRPRRNWIGSASDLCVDLTDTNRVLNRRKPATLG